MLGPAFCTPRLATLALAAAALTLTACSPSLNWRQVRSDAAPLTLLLPCKPDRAQKEVPLGGVPVTLSMLGCEADGVTFAVSVADIGDTTRASAVLAQWQALTLAHMRAQAPNLQPAKVPGAGTDPAPVRVQARGQQADGRAVEGQALYFARGSLLVQAVVYAPRIAPEAADTFFGGLALQ